MILFPSLDMTSWAQLRELDCSIMTWSLPRDTHVCEAYNKKCQEPNFAKTFRTEITEHLACSDYWLRVNDFPYIVDTNVIHRVFWFKPEAYTMAEAKQVILDTTGLTSDNIVVCCNVMHLKSIPELPHYHVFLRLRQSSL